MTADVAFSLQDIEIIIDHGSGTYLTAVLDITDGGRITTVFEKTADVIDNFLLLIRKSIHGKPSYRLLS
jgi:hypothetical protein